MSQTSKGCFVTVGATASFDNLVSAVLTAKFLSSLQNSGYTSLVIQYGKSGANFYSSCLRKAEKEFGGKVPLTVEGFDFKTGDFREYIESVVCGQNGGLLIAHAGKLISTSKSHLIIFRHRFFDGWPFFKSSNSAYSKPIFG